MSQPDLGALYRAARERISSVVAAEGVVVDVGAVMSHAVIVSRELGIPCAVSVTNATRRIPDGALIEVDGSTGTVTVLDLGVGG